MASEPAPTRAHNRSISAEPAELVHHDQTAVATVHVLGHDRADRARRALLGIAGCWGAAILAVFLPVLHFVLVPSLIVAGPLVAFSQLRQHVTILDVEGPCPACGAPIQEKLNRDSRLPIDLRCGNCRRAVQVKLPTRLVEG